MSFEKVVFESRVTKITAAFLNALQDALIKVEKDSVKTVNGVAPDDNGNVAVGAGGVTDTEKSLILTLFRNAAYNSPNMMADAFAQLEALWSGGGDVPDEPDVPGKTLTSISATYNGGEVPVGTAVTALTGIVVTAHYSDGSTATVTDYTLSGEIAEGSNTITVTYQGKTTTFAVNGVADGNIALTWEDGQINNSGIIAGGSHSNIFDVRDVTRVIVTTTEAGWTNVLARKFNSADEEVGAGTGFITSDVSYIDGDPSTDNRGDTAVIDVSNASFICLSLGSYNPATAERHVTVRKE